MSNLSILTWNIYGGLPWGFSINNSKDRIDKIIKDIDTQNCDLVCLQEVHNNELVDFLKKKLEGKYHFFYDERSRTIPYIMLFSALFIIYYLINNVYAVFAFFIFINFIFKNLTAYNFTFGEVNCGLLTLVSRNIKYENINFHGTKLFLEQDGDTLNIFNKRGFHTLQIKKLEIKNSDDNNNVDQASLCLINTHMNTLSKGQFNVKMYPVKCAYRERQIREVEEATRDASYCIVGGDFNTLECHDEFHFAEYGLVDSMRHFNNEDCTWDLKNELTYKSGETDQNTRIDYILAKNLFLHSAKVVCNKSPASDHYALLTKIDLSKKAKDKIEEEKKEKKEKKD
jgi:endonuclease/exonuclease/phosphatase family metal-dependent hydrolase